MGLYGLVALVLLAASVSAMDQFSSEVGLTYGSLVRIISPNSGYMYISLNAASTPTTSFSAEAV